MTKFVEDAAIWTEMDGDSELEKRVNSYLTCRFTIRKDIPSDECLSEAKHLIKLIKKYCEVSDDNRK